MDLAGKAKLDLRQGGGPGGKPPIPSKQQQQYLCRRFPE
jgi:hypothetical protein